MKNKDINLNFDLKSLGRQLGPKLRELQKYSLVGFVALVAVIYGFLFLRISTLANAEPTDNDVTSQVQAARVPHIDESVVQQLKSLQDNSVSVQSLFNDARSNPFQ